LATASNKVTEQLQTSIKSKHLSDNLKKSLLTKQGAVANSHLSRLKPWSRPKSKEGILVLPCKKSRRMDNWCNNLQIQVGKERI